MRFSIVVPVLDEAAGIGSALDALASCRGPACELIVVDGGSTDGTDRLAAARCDRLIHARRGRARQMNAGAGAARGDAIVFLHADTRLPCGALGSIESGLAASGAVWGRFDVRLSGAARLLRVVERSMNLRSRLTGIATGDQALFVRRDAFVACGGFPDIALMEDIELSRRLLALGRPLCLRERVVTSSRRWEQNGILRTIVLMWSLRLRHFLGESPDRLARRYRRGRR